MKGIAAAYRSSAPGWHTLNCQSRNWRKEGTTYSSIKPAAIVNRKTGRKTSLVRKGGLYILRMWVKQPEASVNAGPKK